MIRIKTVFSILFLVFIYNSSLYADPENSCHDQEFWKEEDALIEKNPYDIEVPALYELRIGLYIKVDGGGITLDQATEIFESTRAAIIKKRAVDGQRENDRQTL